MSGGWRWAGASAIGSSHRGNGLPNQDAGQILSWTHPRHGPLLLGVLADGAGSAARADLGAETAVDAVITAVRTWWQDANDPAAPTLDEALLVHFAEAAAAALDDLATQLECPLRELSCTLLLAVITPTQAGYAQLGDGVIVQATDADDPPQAVFWPHSGEYANVTEFLTQSDWRRHLRCTLLAPPVRLALLSDGLQRLALQLAQQQVHAPFFQPFWQALAAADADQYAAYVADLREWLASPRVEARTDDDKTLLLALQQP